METTENFYLLQYILLLTLTYIAAVSDIKTKKIPNTLVLTMIGVWVLTMTPQLFINTDVAIRTLSDAILGFLTGGGLFLLIYIFSRRGLGGGDVKLMAAIGLYLGFAGVISAMVFGSLLSGLVALILLLLKKVGRKDTIPLAPFLFVGTFITVLFGG